MNSFKLRHTYVSFFQTHVPFFYVLSGLLSLAAISCQPAREILRLRDVKNYDPKTMNGLLFLDFTVSRSGPQQLERAILINSIMGYGTLKTTGQPTANPYHIRLVRSFKDGSPTQSDSVEHPLFRSVEIADEAGGLTRKALTDTMGTFSVRLPYTRALNRIELFSITPDRGNVKILTLRLKL